MAFSFDGTNGLYDEFTPQRNLGNGYMWAFWFRGTDSSAFMQPSGYYNGGSNNYTQICFHSGFSYAYRANGIHIVHGASTGLAAYRTTTATYSELSDGAWHHFILAREGDGVIHLYLDGTEITSFSNSRTMGAPTAVLNLVGFNGVAGQNRPDINDITDLYTGDLAEVAFWTSYVTTDNEATSVMHMSPLHWQPDTLVSYMPLHNKYNEADQVTWTDKGTPVETNSHAPITYFQQPLVGQPDTGGGGGGGGGSERRVKLVRDVTAGLTRNLSRNLHNYVPAPLPVG